MSDIGEDFAALKEHSKLKKKRNLNFSTNLLIKSGIEFESKNNGVHLIVTSDIGLIDFWPSTGKFKVRSQTKYGRGVKNLINLIKKELKINKYKCSYCRKDCEITPELSQYPETKPTGYYLSVCCAAEFLIYDQKDLIKNGVVKK